MANIKEQIKKTLYQRCKCCLETDEQLSDMWEAYQCNEEVEVYGEMLQECYDFPWTKPERRYEYICERCIERLRSSLSFRRDILAAQEVLDKLIEDHTKKYTIEIELPEMEENVKSEILETADEEAMDTGEEQTFEESVVDEETEFLQEDDDDDDDVEDDDNESQDSEVKIEYLEEEEDGSQAGSTSTTKRKWPKKKKKHERVKAYKQYTHNQMECAVKVVITNVMSRSEAAEKFGVPLKTLGFKVRQREMDDNAGSKPMATGKKTHIDDMKHYENIQNILACSNATPIKGHWGIGYACCFCDEQFVEPKELKDHTLSHSDEIKKELMKGKSSSDFNVKLDITDLICVICDISIESLEELVEHIEIKHMKMHLDIPNQIVPFKFDSDVLKCVICDKEFEFFKLLTEHMNKHYKNYECSLCDRTFVNYTSLRVHSYRHQGGEFPCNFCTKVFITKARKASHERVVHKLESKAYRCGYCLKRFSDSVSKNKHENIAHGVEIKTFECETCGAKFNRLSSLKHHTQSYHLKNTSTHICPKCAKGFNNKRDLDRHINTHTKMNKYQCEICSKVFSREDNLKYHVKKKHLTVKQTTVNDLSDN